MILCDVGVLLNALVEKAEHHGVCRGELWTTFKDLVLGLDIQGSDTTDAYLAALAMEQGCEWWTTDAGFARFAGLRWRNLVD